jgi:hypothetical protein
VSPGTSIPMSPGFAARGYFAKSDISRLLPPIQDNAFAVHVYTCKLDSWRSHQVVEVSFERRLTCTATPPQEPGGQVLAWPRGLKLGRANR